jgi:hypothetical protein
MSITCLSCRIQGRTTDVWVLNLPHPSRRRAPSSRASCMSAMIRSIHSLY